MKNALKNWITFDQKSSLKDPPIKIFTFNPTEILNEKDLEKIFRIIWKIFHPFIAKFVQLSF